MELTINSIYLLQFQGYRVPVLCKLALINIISNTCAFPSMTSLL